MPVHPVHSTLTFAKAVDACARFRCESGCVNDTVDALVNLTAHLLTDVVLVQVNGR